MSFKQGVVRGLAVRTAVRGPMVEITQGTVTQGQGLAGDIAVSKKRGVTLLSVEQWRETMQELGVDFPWHTRRANVLVEGLDLASTIGHRLRIGLLEVQVWGETKPCDQMDKLCAGLKSALVPQMRGGVHGEWLESGVIRVGDAIAFTE